MLTRAYLPLIVAASLLAAAGCGGSNSASMSSAPTASAPAANSQPVALPQSACQLVTLERARQLAPGMERSALGKGDKNSCFYLEGPENDPVATFTVALIPDRPDYLESVHTSLKPVEGHDSIVNIGDNGVCFKGPQPGWIGTNLSLQVGDTGLGLLFNGQKPGLPCGKLIALVHEVGFP